MHKNKKYLKKISWRGFEPFKPSLGMALKSAYDNSLATDCLGILKAGIEML